MKNLVLLLWIVCGSVSAAEYEDCILNKMPGVANDTAAYSIMRLCREKYPRRDGVTAAKRFGWFDYSSGAECVAKKGKDTPSSIGGRLILVSCNALYEPLRKSDE